jgi:hypothetical protein
MDRKIPVWLAILILLLLFGGIAFSLIKVYERYPDVKVSRDPRKEESDQDKNKNSEDNGQSEEDPTEVMKNVLLEEKRTAESNEKMTLYHLGNMLSPDKSKKLYLEKEFDEGIKRFVRQAIKVENFVDKSKKSFTEKKLSSTEALSRYTGNGCRMEDGFYICCNSRNDFNEFVPGGWIGNGMIWFVRQLDNYQCKNVIKKGRVYRLDGTEFLTGKRAEYLNYSFGDYPDSKWHLEDICSSDDNIFYFILAKDFENGYSIVKFNLQGEIFSDQLVERGNLSDDEKIKLAKIMGSCSNIIDPSRWNGYFEQKSAKSTK